MKGRLVLICFVALMSTGCSPGIVGGVLSSVGSGLSGLAGSLGGGMGGMGSGIGMPGAPGTSGLGMPSAPNSTGGAAQLAPGQAGLGGTQPQDPPPVAGRSPEEQAVDKAMLTQLNALRAQAGAGPLQFDQRLVNAAFNHALDMSQRNYFDHTSLAGLSPMDRAQRAGFSGGVTENICEAGAGDSEAVARQILETYMGSPGHRKNMLDPQMNVCGLGTAARSSAPVKNCQMFSRL
jgi:uncharacterized protein YkwD